MAKKQRAGNSFKQYYTTYKSAGKHSKNKLRRLSTYVKNNPNDEQASNKLKELVKLGVSYVRNKFKHDRVARRTKHEKYVPVFYDTGIVNSPNSIKNSIKDQVWA